MSNIMKHKLFENFVNEICNNTNLTTAIVEGFETIFENYHGEHESPDSSAIPLYDMTKGMPEDIYSNDAKRLYGTGEYHDLDTFSVINITKGKPKRKVKIYRAVPDINKETTTKINDYRSLYDYMDTYGFLPMDGKVNSRVLPIKLDIENSVNHYNKDEVLEFILAKIDELTSTLQPKLKINPGDWVTLAKSYAQEHGRDNLGKYKILSKTVTADTLFTDGDLHEWGYHP
jgi:hypothetical protein